ncbi:MAG TPA: hypothetical protein VFE34_14690 [Dongiaceae bacterium]|nr:hypothetical protein [Dongiaceae bacterium]
MRRASLCALSLYLSFVIVSTAGEKGKDAAANAAGPVNFFLDITSTRLADKVDMSKKRRLDVAGVPVVVGGKRQNGSAAPSVAAGIAGSTKFDLGNHVTMKPSGLLSRAHTNGAGILSSGRVGGDVAIQYQKGGRGLLLRPSLYADLQDDVLDHMDYALESKIWQAIGWGIDLTATAGRAWHASDQLYAEDRETGYGRLGLHMNLFDKSDLELAYGFNTTDGPLATQYRFSQGPSISTHLTLADGWKIDGRYSLTAIARGYDDNDEDARRHDYRHRFNLASQWDLESTTGADWHISADYDFEQTLTDDTVCVPISHTAMLNFALNF